MDKIFSSEISQLRLPLAIAIVCVHNGIDSYPYNSLFSALFMSAVGCFFFISGWLYFQKVTTFDRVEYYLKIKKRFCRLFLPYLGWNAFFVLCYFMIPALKIIPPPKNLWEWLFYCPDYPAWFLRTLFEVELLSLILYPLLGRNMKAGACTLLITGILMFCLPSICDKYVNNSLGIWISHQLIRGLFFWSLGAFCHLWQINVPKSARKLLFLGSGGVLIYLALRYLHIGRIFPLLEICMLIIILALARFLNHLDLFLKRVPGNFPMFLYLFHALLVSILATFLTKHLSIGCAYYIFPLVMLGICTLFYLVISRIPVVFPFLTGELFYAKNSRNSKH